MDAVEVDQRNPDLQLVEDEDGGPDMSSLLSLYRDTITDLTEHNRQQELNYEVRHCIWPGQSDDQRKHAKASGQNEPFPWDGASDLKVPAIDEIINHGVALDCIALSRANVRAVAVGADDLSKASVISNFMRWLLLSQMSEVPDEAEVLANYRRERGIGVLGIFWEKRVQKTQQPVRLEEVAAKYPDVAAAIKQGLFQDEVVKVIRAALNVSAKKAKAMIRQLREEGVTTIPAVVQTIDRPVVKAYAVGEDILFPPNTTDLQSARAVFCRSWMSPEQLREKIITEGWDSDYVDYVIEHCRDSNGNTNNGVEGTEQRTSPDRIGMTGSEIAKGVIEIQKAYRRLSDEDGVPGIYCTIFCPSAHAEGADTDEIGYAKHELLGYRHGMYPFVPFPRERLSRLLLDTRGEPEVGRGFQDAIKTEVDARRDNASLSTCPPVRHPSGREPGRLGPGKFVAERRPGEYGYMEIPPPPAASVEVQGQIEKMLRRYFGRPTPDDPAQEWQTKQTHQIASWLRCWKQVLHQVFALYKQYGPEEQFFRVIGGNTSQPQKFSKAMFDDATDFYLTYDALLTDPETWQAKLNAMGEVAAKFDRSGTVDYSKLLQKAFELIDPVLAEDVLVPSDVAAQKEVQETHSDIAKMMAGIDLDVPQQGINPQLRMQVMQGWMQGPPDNPAVDVQQRVQNDPALQKRLERYSKQLQFQQQQRQNAMIGQMGTAPAGSTGQ